MVEVSPNDSRLGRFIETLVGGEIVRAFVPLPLPPVPPIDIFSLLDRLSVKPPTRPSTPRSASSICSSWIGSASRSAIR